jgi:hypothetical protein
VGVEEVHRRQAEQGLHGVDDANGGIEVVIDKRLRRVRRVLADDQGSGSMGIDVIGTVLGVVL